MEVTPVESNKNSVVKTLPGVTGVPAQGCYARPWASHAIGVVAIAPKASFRLEQKSVPMTPAVDATPRTKTNPFKDSARSGIRTEGPPV
jgi:hypothetical protein